MHEPRGPNGMADDLVAKITMLEAELSTVTRKERSSINQRLHTMRDMLKWCKSRAGYQENQGT